MACWLIGIDCDGQKQVLGLWVGPTIGESAKFWMSVLSEVRAELPGHRFRQLGPQAESPGRPR
ncbi:MAG: transposase [Streptosporangiaceae bacterium]